MKRPQTDKAISEQKEQIYRNSLMDFKLYHRAIVIKTARFQLKTDEQNRRNNTSI